MTITLEIDGSLADILQTTAASRRVTAAELAKQLIADALDEMDAEWEQKNRRRIELIRKSNRQGLSADEGKELQQLQDAADQRLEKIDHQLLEQLGAFREKVEQLPLKESSS